MTVVRVAVGVVRDDVGRVLIALRPPHKHQGSLWEFPGGKIEDGESCEQALQRELWEELGIRVHESLPLIKIPFSYPDKKVVLEVREVRAFGGVPTGKELQPICWVSPIELDRYSFPAANRAIVKAVQLPDFIAITGEYVSEADLLAGIDRCVARGAGLIVLRATESGPISISDALEAAQKACAVYGVPLVVSSAIGEHLWRRLPGLHLRARDLMRLSSRPVESGVWMGASCHTEVELLQAIKIDADYVFLSPVRQTASHPEVSPLGWGRLEKLIESAQLSVYALGGLSLNDLAAARRVGARGVAGIGEFWGKEFF